FKANAAATAKLVDELKARMAVAAQGGDERSRKRHTSRDKLLPRERVERLVDPGSPFLELSPLAAFGMYEGDIHAAGIITGIGRVAGRECVIVCNDATIKGGTYYPITVKKHLRAQEIARENRLPCVYLVDSGGANLPNQAEHALAVVRRTVANLNAAKIPYIPLAAPRPPAYDPHELDGIIPQSLAIQYDVREVIARLVDGSVFDEFKRLYATTIVTGFA